MSSLLARMTLQTYRYVGMGLYPFLGPYLRIRAKRGKEDRRRRYERYGYPSAEKPKGPIVWFHAASVGESLAVIPLIERVESLGIHTIMTTGTVTSAEMVKERLPKATYHQYVPLDLGPAVKRFLDHWQPDLAVFTESEIWPMTVLEMGARRIPQVLVNARMSDRSFKRWESASNLAAALFENYAHVIAQSELDAGRFRALGASPVTISGNLKVDTEPLPVDAAELSRLQKQIGNRPVWVAASTHAGEEEIASRVHRALSSQIKNLLTIIVPRHPERSDEIVGQLKGRGDKVSRRSNNDAITPETDVYLGDTIGEMGLFLRLSKAVFVGRSLAASGGQNPIEPAMTGTPIVSGNKVGNFRDAYKALVEKGGVRLVNDEKMLASNIAFLLSRPDECEKMIKAAKLAVEGMGGALAKTIQVLDSQTFPLTVKRGLEEMQ